MKYEYKRIEPDIDELNELGLSGWRLVMKETITKKTMEYDYYLLERQSQTREQSSSMNVPIEERRVNFIKAVEAHRIDYNQHLIASFIEYWSEHNPNGKKMKFEMQKTWKLSSRLATWKRNSNNFNGNNKPIVNNDL